MLASQLVSAAVVVASRPVIISRPVIMSKPVVTPPKPVATPSINKPKPATQSYVQPKTQSTVFVPTIVHTITSNDCDNKPSNKRDCDKK